MIHLHVACWIIPLLQVASIGVVGRIPIGGFAVKDRDNNYRIRRFDPYHVVSDYWVAHSEIVLIDLI